ncbi:MAG: glycosyltransferase [Ignavibacteriales bacterium]|nr:glycosyltransferase [Ignavibacteriales bacterium]
MFEIVFLIAVSIYFLQSVIFLIGSIRKFKRISEAELPTVSIIVAARNEEDNIVRCLKSLDQVIYPNGRIEIMLINDNSTDKTLELIEKFILNKPRFKCLTTKKIIGNLKGKTNALANGLEIATGEIILTTDADCAVSPTWAKAIASYYQKDVAMVCGYTSQKVYNSFSGMQSLDFMYLLTVAAGTMNLNMPLSCIGNNMSYRKSVYDEVGGYENIPFSVTEDFKLLKTFFNLKKYKIIFPLEPEAHVVSKPCENLKSVFWQKKRWGVGGLDSGIIGFLVMASGFVAHICILLLAFFFTASAVYITVFKLATDFLFLYPILKQFNLTPTLKHFFAFELFFIIYVVLLPFVVLPNRKVLWKGRNY